MGILEKIVKVVLLYLCTKVLGMVVVVLYSIGTLSCMRESEREREGLLEELEVGLKGQEDDERKGENRKKVMSVVVVVCGLWFTFHFFFIFAPNLVVQV